MACRLDVLFLPRLKEHFADSPFASIYIKSYFQPIKGKYAKGHIFVTSLKLIVAVFFLSILVAQVHALTPGEVFDKVKDTVVVVKTMDALGKVKVQGSGVLISSGRVATNCHVVEGGASYLVGRGKQLVPATLYAQDGDKDICILDAHVPGGKPAQLGKAAGLKVGDPVYAVGAPMGLELSLSDGIVAQLRGGPPPLIQATAAISPGSSGGGLFDGEGRLVGLTTLYVEGGQSLNFAMPVEWIGEIKAGRETAGKGFSQIESSKRAMAWHSLGAAYLSVRRFNDAIEAFRQALRIDPKDPKVWFNLGVAYSNLNRYNDAIEAHRQSLRIDPEFAWAWYDLGVIYGNLNRYNDAIEALRQAVSIDPEFALAWRNLGVAYALSGNRTAALDAVRQLRRLDPKQADELFNLIVPR